MVNSLIVLCLTFGAWIAFEICLIIRDKGKALRTRNNGGKTILLSAVAAIMLAVLLSNFRLTLLPGAPEIHIAIGSTIMLLGIFVRTWAISSLGNSFSTFIAIKANQRIVRAGPYRLVRHPSYLGSLLGFVGFAVALGSVVGICATLILVSMGYYRRINIEEQTLLCSFGDEYGDYMKKTKRLVPLVY